VPDDLVATLAGHPGARERWERIPALGLPSGLEWIVQVKRPNTRARRIADTACLIARGNGADRQVGSSSSLLVPSAARHRLLGLPATLLLCLAGGCVASEQPSRVGLALQDHRARRRVGWPSPGMLRARAWHQRGHLRLRPPRRGRHRQQPRRRAPGPRGPGRRPCGLRRAVAICTAVYGADHPTTPTHGGEPQRAVGVVPAPKLVAPPVPS
jgi:hypothetical protein